MRTEPISVVKLENKNSLKAVPIRHAVPISYYRYNSPRSLKTIYGVNVKILFHRNGNINIPNVICFGDEIDNGYFPILAYPDGTWGYDHNKLKFCDYYNNSKSNKRRLNETKY